MANRRNNATCSATVRRIGPALYCLVVGIVVNNALATPPAGYLLTWSDEFSGTALNTAKWTYVLGERNDAVNTQDAVTVGGGNLTITTYTSGGTNYTGMITTYDSYQQKYGYFEANIRFHDELGMWSAFWMKWGTPEIDIAEHWKYGAGGTRYDANAVQNALHWAGGDVARLTNNMGLASGFHTYGVSWKPTGFKFYVDNQVVLTNSDPAAASGIQVPLELILSSEVNHYGGVGDVPAGGYGSRLTSTTKMDVDYVRAYAITLYGDANLDGTVSFADLNTVLTNYNKAGTWNQGDFNNDGLVDFTDLNTLLTNYNHSLASNVVPTYSGLDAEAIRALSLAGLTVAAEPSTLALAGFGLLALVGHRWWKRK
jgi:beta-glucanase (GH16 family)